VGPWIKTLPWAMGQALWSWWGTGETMRANQTPPCWGGGDTLSGGGRYTLERLAGSRYPPYSLGDPPRWPPDLGTRLCPLQRCWESSISIVFWSPVPILPIFQIRSTSHSPNGYFLHDHMFFVQNSSSGGIASSEVEPSSRRVRFSYS